MRFDPDLARAIMQEVEKAPANRGVGDIQLDGYTEDEIVEHIELLNDAGYLDARLLKAATSQGRIYAASITRLTYSGHQFLEAARNESGWTRAKSSVAAKGGAMTLEILKAVLIETAKRAVGLPPG